MKSPTKKRNGTKANDGNATAADAVPAHLQHMLLIVGQMRAAQRAGVEIGNAFEEVLNGMIESAADHVAGTVAAG